MSITAKNHIGSMLALVLTLSSLLATLGLLFGAYSIAQAAPALPITRQETGQTDLSPALFFSPYLLSGASQGDPTRYVAPSGTDSGPCTNPAAPCRTIQYAVNQAIAGDEVLIATGVYTANGQGQVVLLNKTVLLRGGYTPTNWTTPDPIANPTILDGENAARVIWIASGASPTVEGFHLRHGRAENGGGVLIEGGSPQLRRNRLYNNTAILDGGGVYVAAGEPVLENNLIYANTTVAGRGGGLYVAGGAPVLRHNTLYGNQADEQGGGAYLSAGTTEIRATIIVSNTAGQGGGVYRSGGSPTLDYNDVWGNAGGDYGGGVSAGSHSTSTNPLFMDAATADFHLQSDSPCRDWVPITQTVTVDFEGLARPFGPRSDIGAYEFYTGTCFARVEAGQVYTTVQAAVDAAGAGDTVKVAGFCTGSGTGPVVLLNKTLILRGGYTLTNWSASDPAAHPTILDGEGSRRVVSIGNGSAVIEGLHIRRGYLTSSAPNPAGGAGIYITGGNPTVRHNNIYSNTVSGDAGRGAGIYATGGQPVIQDNEIYDNLLNGQNSRGSGLCFTGGVPRVEGNHIHHNKNNQFGEHGGGGFYASISTGLFQNNDIHDNEAYLGGGGTFYESGNPTFQRNRIYNNTAQMKGGGLHIHFSRPTVEKNQFYGNQTTGSGADSGGGAIYVYYSNCSPLIRENDLHDNHAAGSGNQGGGIHLYVWGSSRPVVERNAIHHNTAAGSSGGLLVRAAAASTQILVRNNLIYSNSTDGNGGGLSLRENPTWIESNTIYGNQATAGGGIYVFIGSGHFIHNNIIANNTSYGLFSATTLSDSYCDVWGNALANYGGGASAGTGSISQNPQFVNPAGGDLRLQAGSPCIDQADPANYPTEDYAGWARPFGPQADMGAYEFYSGTCFARVGASQVYTTPQAAVDAAPSGSLVQVAGYCQGVQGRTVGSETLYQTVYISQPLTLRGGYTLTNWLTPTSVTTLDAQGGGRGVYLAGSGPITVEGLVIRGGSASTGGGLYLSEPLVATIQNVIFYNNMATNGGGLASAGGAPRLYNNTFAYNMATNNGGGLYLAGSTPVLSNTIVVSNSASAGGGLYVVPGTSPSLAYNDFWHNNGGDYAGVSPGSTDLTVDPSFVDPAGGDLHLRPDSLCLHTADPTTGLQRDLEGDPRPLGRGYDIGADESALYPDVIFAPDRQGGGIPGQIIVHQHILTNSGSITDSYYLTHTLLTGGPAASWKVVDYTPIFTLASGEAVAVPVTVMVPNDAISGSYALVILTATSQANVAIYDTVQDTTIVNWNPGVRLVPEYHEYVNPGTVISYVHILTNTGNAPDTFQIVWSSDRGWTTVTPTLVSNLGPHLTTTVWVNLAVPATMPGGEAETTRLQVNSLLPGSGASTAITDTFTVVHVPGDRYVTTGGDNTLNNCLVYTYPCATIEYAVGQAVTGDKVKVAAGTYNEHDILLNKKITLRGGYPASGPWEDENFIPELHITTINAGGKGRVLNILGSPTVEGFHLVNGSTAGSGGAVYISSGAPLLRRNSIHDNHADRLGGGVYNALGSLTLERNIFYNNSAGLDGGGFYHALGNSNVWNNLFYGNRVTRNGGGLYTAAGSPRLWHNTLYGNQATSYGGGLYIGGGSPTISNTILVNNIASLTGGGLYRGGGSPAADYNDVWANSGGDYGGGLSAGPHDLSVDPQFVNPGQADYHLQESSPCIDRGDTTFLTEDIDGHPRPISLAPDIGADEYLVVGALLEPDNAGPGYPGLPVTYTHVLTNIGFYTDTFSLAARSSHGWPTQVLSRTATVGPGLTAPVVVMVQVPAGTLSGTVDTMIVTATSGFSPYPSDTAVNTTTVVLALGALLEPDYTASILSNPSQPRPLLFTHLLTNTGNYTDTFNLTWSSSAGLPVTVTPAQATLGPGQSQPVWVTVTVPALNPATLLVDTTHVTATSQSSPIVHDPVTDTTFVNRIGGVEFAPDRSGRGRPGELILYNHVLTNTGNYTDTFQLTSSGWGIVLGPGEITLGPNDSRAVQVEVIIPSLAISGTANTTLVTATSEFSPTIYDPPAWSGPVSDTVTDITLVERVVDVDLRKRVPEGEGWCIIAPDTAVYTFRLINLGNYTDTFDITASSEHGWPVTINPNPVTLGPWQRSNVVVAVSVPPIITQTEDLLLVTATSRADPSVSDSDTYITRVNWNVDAELAPDRTGTVILENSIVYTHLLTNTGEIANTFLLGGWSSHGWTLLVSPAIVNLPPGGSVPVSVTLFIPPDVIYAQDMAIISTTTTLYCPAYDSALEFTTVTRPHVTLYPDRQGEAGPGTAITYTHFVSNSGAIVDHYTLTATNSLGWPVQVIPTTTSNLQPGQESTVLVVVHVPAGIEVGTINMTTITATSQYAPTIFDTAVDTTTVPYLPGALLEPECHRQADPGATIVCTHTLHNTGNYTDTFYLTTHGEFAYAEVEPTIIGPLSPGEAYGPVSVTIWIPAYAAGGQTEHTEVIVTFDSAQGQAVTVDTTEVNYVNGTRYVAPTGLDAYNNCLDLNYGPCATVQYAVSQALSPDLIKVATGVYTDLHTFGGNNQVVYLTKTLTLRGGYTTSDWENWDPDLWPTKLDAAGQGRVIVIVGTGITPTVEGFYLTGGWTEENGGGLYVASGALPTIRMNTIYSNTAANSGGGLYSGGGNLTLERNTLYNNTALSGGGFYLHSGNSSVWNNLLYDNRAEVKGGGLYILSGNPTVLNNTFYNNAAGTNGGGGIYIAIGSPVISQTIVANNTNYGLYNSAGSPLPAYNDLWGNSEGDSNIPPGPGSFSANPRFANAAQRDLHLSGASPCIDAGQPGATLPTEDREGSSRPLGLRHDVGAYEYRLFKAKQAPSTADPGTVIAYTLILTNSGAVPQPGVIVTDTLHPYLDYAGTLIYSHGHGEYLTASRTISWTGTVYPDAPTLITFTARITDWLAAGTEVTNVAWVDLARSNVVTTTINAVPGTRHVATTGEDPHNNCLVPWKPCATIQYATNQALDGDQVKVAGGLYTDSLGIGCVISLTKSLDFTGGFSLTNWTERDPLLNPTTLDAQNSGRGVCIAGPLTTSLTGFRITAAAGPGVDAYNAHVTLLGNLVYGNSQAGVHLHGNQNYRLVNNILARNGYGGLRADGGSGVLIHNTFAENEPTGAVITGTATLTNTLFYSHPLGLNATAGTASLWHTLWYANDTNSAGTVISSTNLFDDPMFVNPAAVNYHIRSRSAALDAGLDVGIDEDVDTGPRPLLAAPDIGADEYPLAVSKRVQPTADPGQVITYTISIQGEETGLIVTDTLHPYLDYAGTVACSSGDCSYLPAQRSIVWAGNVASPPPVVITFTAQITDWLAAGTIITNHVEGLVSGDHFRTLPVVTVINAVPGTRHVATTGEDTHNNCLVSWKPCATIQYATNQALDGDQVKVAGGLYTDSLGIGCVISLTKSLDFTGGFSLTNWTERDPLLNPTTLDAQNSGRGVCIAGPLTTSLTGFRITAAAGPGVDAYNAHVTLLGNLVYGNSQAGVHLHGNQNYRLVNNILARNGYGGLRADGGSGVLIHNTFAENEPTGAVITGTATLTNTLFYSHPLGLDATAGTASLWHTLWYANDTNSAGTVISSTNLFEDPMFVNPAAVNYHLQGDSPALSAGLWAGEGEDIDRDLRPADQPPDLGADQYPLRVTRWVEPVAALPCEVVTHTLHLTSLDNTPLTGVQLRDPLPTEADFGGWIECSTGTCTYASGAITWLGPVENSAPTTIRYTAVLTPYLISGTTIVHIATITDSLSTFHSAPVTVTARTTDALLAKVAPLQATIGQVVTYTLLYTVPAGHMAYQPLMVDRLPAPELIYLPSSASPPPAQVAPDGGTITWTLPTVTAPCGAPQVVTVTFAGQVQDLPENERGDLLTNTVTLSYTEAAGGPAHQMTTTRSLILVEPVVNLDKQMAPESGVGVLAPVYITLTLNNSGDSPLYDSVLTDTLPEGLELLAATPGYQEVGQTVTWTLVSLLPGTQAVYTITARVNEEIEPGATLVNYAGVEGSSLPGSVAAERIYTATAQATATAGYPDLAVNKERGPAVRSPGQVVTYTILYANTGVLPATQVRLVDTLPPLLTEVISATSVPATVERTGQIVTWTLPGMLEPNMGGTIWITGTISLAAQDGEVLINTVTITSTTPEQNLENNTASVTTTVRRPALSISKTASPSAVMPGDQLNYTLSVQNSGQGEATGLIISDTIPLTTTYLFCSGGDQCSLQGNLVIWNIASLPPDSSVQVAFAVQVNQNAVSGTYIENLSYGVICDQGETAQGEPVRVPVAPAGGLSLEPDQAGEGRPGQQVVYTHTLTNASNVAQTINLSAVSSHGWAVSVTPTTVALPAGASTSVTVRVTVAANAPSGTVDTTTVTAHGLVIGHDTATDTTTITGNYVYLPLIVRQH